MKKTKNACLWAMISLCAAVLYTLLVKFVDVRAIGPQGSSVGFAALNGCMRDAIGVHPVWDKITDVCLAIEFLLVAVFGVLALLQLIRGKSWYAVDDRLKLQIFFYGLVALVYIFFEIVVINCRPILTDEGLEASYPSSHTLLALTIFLSGFMTVRRMFRDRLPIWVQIVLPVLALFAVVGRMLSGMHWFSDILGGILFSAALLLLYRAALIYQQER